jgi:hypothetical protein
VIAVEHRAFEGMMIEVQGIIPAGEFMRSNVKRADVSTEAARSVNVEAPTASGGVAVDPQTARARGGLPGGAIAKPPVGGIRFSRRAMLLIVLVLAGGAGVWYWASRPDDVEVVGTTPVGTSSGWAGAAAPGVVRIRTMDVLAGIPDASTPERSEGPVTWSSYFTLAGGEAGVLTMRSDPADLNYASITLPIPAPNDDASADRIRVTARRYPPCSLT